MTKATELTRLTELRRVPHRYITEISLFLCKLKEWEELMENIPISQINAEEFDESEFKYKFDDIRKIRNHAMKINELPARILFDEWGTSGRIRPNLGHLLKLLTRLEMFGAADYVATCLLNEPPPIRPTDGAGMNIEISGFIDGDDDDGGSGIGDRTGNSLGLSSMSSPPSSALQIATGNNNIMISSNNINKDNFVKPNHHDFVNKVIPISIESSNINNNDKSDNHERNTNRNNNNNNSKNSTMPMVTENNNEQSLQSINLSSQLPNFNVLIVSENNNNNNSIINDDELMPSNDEEITSINTTTTSLSSYEQQSSNNFISNESFGNVPLISALHIDMIGNNNNEQRSINIATISTPLNAAAATTTIMTTATAAAPLPVTMSDIELSVESLKLDNEFCFSETSINIPNISGLLGGMSTSGGGNSSSEI